MLSPIQIVLYTLAVEGMAAAGSIKDVEHIVLFMQESKANCCPDIARFAN